MSAIRRPLVILPQAPAEYNQKDQNELRRLIAAALSNSVESTELVPALTITNAQASNAGAAGPPWNRLVVTFTATNFPNGTTYDVTYSNGVDGGVGESLGNTGSPVTMNTVTFGALPTAAPGSGAVTVTAKLDGVTLAVAVRNRPYNT